MKSIILKRYNILLITSLFLVLSGCKDSFLEEVPKTSLTTDVYYKTAAGFEDLVRSTYPLLRNIHQSRGLVNNGTDIFSSQGGWNPSAVNGKVNDPSAADVYDARFNATSGEVQQLWQLLYAAIARTNTVVSRAEGITTMAPALKDVRVSEAKFLRALCFFYAVQNWGDIPMPLKEVTTPSKDFPRVPAADVYKQIIADLLECESKLPAVASNYGRATKGAAQFLLSKVYLTRGWNYNNSLGGSSADFDAALQYADKIIDAYPLATNYKDLFPKRSDNPLTQYTGAQNDKNAEIIFSVQYNSDVLTNKTDAAFTQDPAGGNDLHSRFGPSGEGFIGSKGRTSDYNRSLNVHKVNTATYRFFDPTNDTRYAHNFVSVGYALSPVTDYKALPLSDVNVKVSFAAGDTVLYCRPWNNPATSIAERGVDLGGTKKYAVVNTDEFGGGYPIDNSGLNIQAPLMWKFWQPGIPYGDAYGTFNESLFRAAEAYLIAAEAIVKGAKNGKLGGAENYYNKVLDRALGAKKGTDPLCAAAPENQKSLDATSYRATAANISIDLILDERARELMGEYGRWFDLKRTGKLVERVKKYNPWKVGQAISDKHYLRPIPQSEIDLSFPAMTQNKDY
ncbi:Starch-binding associating with outer membrane [Spirosomataceae bacterium TFI 002]|nr:Starch-binding associating with outer membrane [Spirosomataceae bacterium TFI 002]